MINEGIMNHIDIKKPDLKYYSAEAYKSLRSNLQFCGGDKKRSFLQAVHKMKERHELF